MTTPSTPPARPDPLLGADLDGRYQLEELLGSGGMGRVYRARHLRMDQVVAVKLLSAEAAQDPEAVRRFAREAKRSFRFDHPHCVRVLDFDVTAEGRMYMVMEFLRGRTVGRELAVDGPSEPARVVHIAAQMCAALSYAHGQGVIHRDLKPDNTMLMHRDGDPDFVKVFDFGLATLSDEVERATAAGMSLTSLTREGIVYGTPAYMSPEQAMGEALGPATDIYALGVTMYEMLTGVLPFDGASFTAVLAQHVQEPPTPPSARAAGRPIPPLLDGLVLACLAKQPGHRPQSAQALAAELERVAAGGARPRATLAATVDPLSTSSGLAETALPASPDSDALALAATLMASGPAASPASGPASAAAMASGGAGRVAPSAPAPAPAAASAHAHAATGEPPRAAVADTARGARQRRQRWPLIAAVVALMGLALAIGALLGSRFSSAPASPPGVVRAAAGDSAELALPPASAEAAASELEPGAALGAPAAAPASATTAAAPSAATASAPGGDSDDDPAAGAATDRHRPARRRPGARSSDAGAVAEQLAAARAARAAGNHLEQLAAADSALRLAPGNRQAAFLLGDALLASGDTARGCRYLRRAGRLPAARAARRRADCPSD
ncbi:serine/threonine-protein kinase [Haliangium ochraceum]|uniref:non-specific serine/threonine protein kinase n=1 Tax=Haliangium ochraceum (strain DSM 14365 / JCM 11303 / SMP-2) TaxID=502025 RepID=D0LXE0_HALO1|nr:serine/threonine-protein kinase [Haliangium ochraceum]ACY16182.1 serine/threonine protein kinase [Haliangium ochraceum DSM 14365]